MSALAPPTAPRSDAAMPAHARSGPDFDAQSRLARAYTPLQRRLFGWAFSPVRVPAEASEQLRELADRGIVVHVGRSAAFVTFVFFQHLFFRVGAPVAQAVTGLGARVWKARWFALAGRRRARAPLGENAVEAVRRGESAMVFLRKPGSLAAAVRDVPDPFPALVAAQRELSRPILLVPELLIWERRPRHLRRSLMDVLFGEPETPGLLRSLFSLIWNRNRAFVKFGEPIDLKQVIDASPGLEDAVIARKVRGALHQHLARETRVVVGPPLKSPERLVDETLRDPALRATLAEVARERGRADGSVEREAERDLREIAARYSPRAIEAFKWVLDWVFERIYDGVEVDQEGIQRIAKTSSRTPIIVCPSHKSHIDYLVMSLVFYNNGLVPPHIAAGINLSFWPLGTIFRKAGAFFIRRSFKGDKVYQAVMKAYVKKLLKDGFSQEFFVEGGRSRTGKVLHPKFGMLAMEVDAWIDGVRPDVAFVPTWIGYAKIIEQGSYAHELAGGEKKPEDLGALLRAPKVLTSRYGRVYIRFDVPLSLAEVARQRGFDRETHTEEQKRALVRAVGFRIVEGVNRATALTETGLLCTALLAHDRRGLDARELVERMQFLLQLALDEGAALTFHNDAGALDPLGTGPVGEARVLLERDKSVVVHRTGGETILAVPDQARVALDYYKNATIHYFVADALLCTALLTTQQRDRATVQARTQALSRHLKQEFIYGGQPFATIFERRLQRLLALGMVAEVDGQLQPTKEGAGRVRMLADLLTNFVETYLSANDALRLLLKGPLEWKDLLKQTMDHTRAAFLAGRLRKYETLSKVTFENAFALFEEQGVLLRTGEKGRQRALAPAWASEEAIDRRVEEIRSFLIEKAE